MEEINDVYALQIQRNTLFALYKIKRNKYSKVYFKDNELYINGELFEYMFDKLYLKQLCKNEGIEFVDANKKRILNKNSNY